MRNRACGRSDRVYPPGLALRFLWVAFVLSAAMARADQPAAKPDCTVSDVRAAASAAPAAPAPPKLSVELRRAIFIDLQQVLARAQRDAATAYPTAENGAMLSPTNVEKDAKLSKKRDSAALSLERSYLADLLKQRALTCAAAREIVREGREAHWPSQSQK